MYTIGVSFNLWESGSTTLPLLLTFCKQTPFTTLIECVCQFAPRLVATLFETTLLRESACHSQLLEAVCARFEFIAPLPGYEQSIRSVLCSIVEQLFEA
jgi:hypothetical protein